MRVPRSEGWMRASGLTKAVGWISRAGLAMAPKVYPARPGTTAVAQSPGMKIVYVCYGALEQGPAGPTSKMASMRYRAIVPARELRRLGHDVRIVVAGEGAWSEAEVEALRCDVVVVSKSFNA